TRYISDPYALKDALCSEVWRLNIASLLNQHSILYPLLQQWGGEHLEEKLQALYEQVTEEIHRKMPQFDQTKFNPKRAIRSGLADFGFFGGHRRSRPRTDAFKKVHDQWTNPKNAKNTELICSEFVAKSIIAALLAMEVRLKGELKGEVEADIKFSEAEKANYKKWIDEADTPMFNIPFDANERLKRIHPGRIIRLLNRLGALEKINPPKFLSQICAQPQGASLL
ncbi:MAG: uncharacterized protein K0S07_1787, partial [Chlamydiales bacterium]|nr:uncharacterized protein [Chlamydiales bacterium]